MARAARRPRSKPSRSARLTVFEAFQIEGALLSPEIVERVINLEAGAQSEADYQLDPREKLRDVVTTKFALAQSLHARFVSSDMGPQATRRFLVAFFTQVLEFTDLVEAPPQQVEGRTYPITHQAVATRVPLVLAPPGKLDEPLPAFGDAGRRRSAAQLMQEYLNAEPASLWGIVCDGVVMRLYRDNSALTRPAYIEADLLRMFDIEAPRLADFSALWLTTHSSRFGRPDAQPSESAIERWREEGLKQGATAREELKKGVEKALKDLGLGLMEHRANEALRAQLRSGALSPQEFLQALLRLIYRFIFVLTAEDRGVLHSLAPDDDAEFEAWRRGKEAYAKGYGLGRLRDQRIGQDIFRDSLLEYWSGACAVTGLDQRQMLRASHTKAWAACADAPHERLDVFNGFLLSADLDAAFDVGLVTFDDAGSLVLSNRLSSIARARLGDLRICNTAFLRDEHRRYLSWHRTFKFVC